MIGIVTFAHSFFGVFIVNRFIGFFENRIEIVGGLILIDIGVKILLEELMLQTARTFSSTLRSWGSRR